MSREQEDQNNMVFDNDAFRGKLGLMIRYKGNYNITRSPEFFYNIYEYLCSDVRWLSIDRNIYLNNLIKNELLGYIKETEKPLIQEKLITYATILGYDEVPCKRKTRTGLSCRTPTNREYCTFHFNRKVNINDTLSSSSLNIPLCIIQIIIDY